MQSNQASTAVIDSTNDTSGIWGQPNGLTTLFFTEFWERFSYYGMRAILLYYMIAPVSSGGLGMDIIQGTSLYGTYTMMVYLMTIPGGWLADKFIGAKLAVVIGGITIALGHFSLAMTSMTTFYLGLLLVVLGTGLLKANISAMVGQLYSADDVRRDSGFSIFYMGINIGGFLSPLVCGWLAQSSDFKALLMSWGINPASCWHWGFAASGVGMTFGLVHLYFQRSRIAHVGKKTTQESDNSVNAIQTPLTVEEWKRIGAIFILFVFTILFWALYEQAGTSLALFADKLTNNVILGWEVPSSWYQSYQPVLVIFLAPVFSWLWIKLKDRQPSSPAKFAYGLFFISLSFLLMVPATKLAFVEKASPLWLITVYILQVIGELCLSPVGLSTVTKLAPARFVGMMMGVWFLAAALGNKLAGTLGGLFDENNLDTLVGLFGYCGLAVLIAAGILAALTPSVRKLMGKVH